MAGSTTEKPTRDDASRAAVTGLSVATTVPFATTGIASAREVVAERERPKPPRLLASTAATLPMTITVVLLMVLASTLN